MSLILNIETTTTNCSVTLANQGKSLALHEENRQGYSHAELLHLFIQRALIDAEIEPDQLDAVAVSMGPGSYTGLRIGVSAAKGLCYALDVPLIALPTLDLLAQTIQIDHGCIVPMLDARRMEVYTAVYDANHHQIQPTEAMVLDPHSFLGLLNKGPVHFVGNGAEKTTVLIQHPNAHFHPEKCPSAKEMSTASYLKFTRKEFEDLAYFEPYYLKEFVGVKSSKRFKH